MSDMTPPPPSCSLVHGVRLKRPASLPAAPGTMPAESSMASRAAQASSRKRSNQARARCFFASS